MKVGSDFASGSSSIGYRVRSRHSIRDKARESMSSSGSSLGLSAEIEEIMNAAMGEASSIPEGSGLSPVGPVSVIGVEEVACWRMKFHLLEDLVIRIPGPFETASDFRAGEIPVYEGFFESGFRDRVPSHGGEISRAVNISWQLNPPAWRTLIAMQNLGDLEGLTIGVAERTDTTCILVARHHRSRAIGFEEEESSSFQRESDFEICFHASSRVFSDLACSW
ncbi:hypothetical protein Bca52824_016387 [Brassica carinata]|uniref:Uncharacterized protein n=1 Tax=Brassica carinata TaxID=52824 RepID=A0A8X7W3K1_BRACI|nr:hypothetical protein Bca52824_016387 [Brassica carinata]